MTEDQIKDKFLGSIVGLAVCDALGGTNEFLSYKEVQRNPVTDIVGGGAHELKPGEWTDDTTMMLCLAESLFEKDKFDPIDQMTKYLGWYRHGYNSVKGRCFDIGGATRDAILHFESTGDPYAIDPKAGGNGAIMRLAPVPLYCYGDKEKTLSMAAENSKVTHNSSDSIDSCELMAAIIYQCIENEDKSKVVNTDLWPTEFKNILIDSKHLKVLKVAQGTYFHKTKPLEEINPLFIPNGDETYYVSGNAHAPLTLETAMWGFYNTTNFKEGALDVVNLGGDADTTGAVYGQIAGAFYGLSGIPEEWVNKIVDIDRIKEYAIKLYELNKEKRINGRQ